MSTRGAVGFRINGEYLVAYNSHDSYPSSLGKKASHLLNSLKINDWEALKILFSTVSVSHYEDTDKLPLDNIEDIIMGRTDTFFVVGNAFIKGDITCSWVYIINLDDNLFEVWEGYQKIPQKGNPLGNEKRKRTELYPCARVLVIPLEKMPENWVKILEDGSKKRARNRNKIHSYNKTPVCLSFEEELNLFLSKNFLGYKVDEKLLKKIKLKLKKFLNNYLN